MKQEPKKQIYLAVASTYMYIEVYREVINARTRCFKFSSNYKSITDLYQVV